jgi:CRP/FNR family cyclic AMP-dependent transcriptional regulator
VEGAEESRGPRAEATAMSQSHLDLRGLPVWERPERVFDQFDRLPPGEAFTFVVDNEPRGLTSIVEEQRKPDLILDRRRISESEWHVTVRRSIMVGDVQSPRSILGRTHIFAGLDAESRDAIAATASTHTARRGHVVAAANTEWPYIGIPFEGNFAVTNDASNARYRIFHEVTPFEIFGEMSLFDGGLTPARTVVLSKTGRYLRVSHAGVLAIAAQNPELLRRLGATVTQRSREMMQTLVNQGTTPVIERIASVLLPYAVPEAGLAPALAPLPNLTQAHIAAAAGTVKEVAARAIAELESRGLLLRERGHIRFLNRSLLIALVRESA